jgi:broad specificity phosphatase PhoE
VVSITLEWHASSTDNEAHRSSGHADVELSKRGVQQARQLGDRYSNSYFDAVFCSDLKRSYATGEIAFGDRDWPIIRDARLRECDYGDFTQHPSQQLDLERPKRINVPFANGESYEDAAARMGSFLKDLLNDYDKKNVLIIGHGATQIGLEHWIKGVTVKDAVISPPKWQPTWRYQLERRKSMRPGTK